jgi:hypothetical protein
VRWLRGMTVFYAVWAIVCALSFMTSTLFGFVTIALGIGLHLLERILETLRNILNEHRTLRLELRQSRLVSDEKHS